MKYLYSLFEASTKVIHTILKLQTLIHNIQYTICTKLIQTPKIDYYSFILFYTIDQNSTCLKYFT